MSGLSIELSRDEALVLVEFLSRSEEEGSIPFKDRAEELVLCRLLAVLESSLVEVVLPEYEALLSAARHRLRNPPESS